MAIAIADPVGRRPMGLAGLLRSVREMLRAAARILGLPADADGHQSICRDDHQQAGSGNSDRVAVLSGSPGGP